MLSKQQLVKLKDWYYPNITSHTTMKVSGWKFYIFGEDVDDSLRVCELLTPVAEKYNFTMKVASQPIIDRNVRKKTIAWSIGVIYLHVELFSEHKIKDLLKDIDTSLKNYNKSGVVRGAKSINGKVHYRYDLTIPVDPEKGVVYQEYVPLYRGEYGGFNIPENADIVDLFK